MKETRMCLGGKTAGEDVFEADDLYDVSPAELSRLLLLVLCFSMMIAWMARDWPN